MALKEQDRIDITNLINLHGHLVDAGDPGRLDELFTADVIYDYSDMGFGELHGRKAIWEAALALGDANPVGHHVTNIVITGIDDDSARVRSKGIGIHADGTAASVVYDDIVIRHPDGWKISRRTTTARRAVHGGRENSPQ
ncbi:nuclear transport factor 2 family protein [Yinghuangia sp. ASG 101]|uniref:nuclear transport factor 2 family protein n=1 Tax=Yinghuangia sp. ASG 101 TaxID=2896848 RepID=UPI001E4B4EE7|nr:nuclear transport factor 2 family protein [Yinghuangia sp. ASG 101]UGQ12324.1 nuclear transport factor 2 family protein [Yinghuangia sp. ASG 101]